MPREPPHLVFSDVRVRDLESSIRFYRALGLRPIVKGGMTDGTRIVWMRDQRTGQVLELFHLGRRSRLYEPFRPRRGSEGAISFSVDRLRPLVRRLEELGAKRVRSFCDGDAELTFLRDPNGALLELISWTAEGRSKHSEPPLLHLRGASRPRGRRRRS